MFSLFWFQHQKKIDLLVSIWNIPYFQEESEFLSNEETNKRLPEILEEILEDLNELSSCVIPIGKKVMVFINPLHAKFFRENINTYLHFVSFIHIDTMQVVEIPPQIRQEPTYSP